MDWPEKNKAASFMDLASAVRAAIDHCYKLKRRNQTKDVVWTGPPVPEDMQATCLAFDEALSAEGLAWVLEDQGREAIDALISVALQLGIEQGRRIIVGRVSEKVSQLESVADSWGVQMQAQLRMLRDEIERG